MSTSGNVQRQMVKTTALARRLNSPTKKCVLHSGYSYLVSCIDYCVMVGVDGRMGRSKRKWQVSYTRPEFGGAEV